MRKTLVLAAVLLLLTGFGAAMNRGELIDRIADDANLKMERGVKIGDTVSREAEEMYRGRDDVDLFVIVNDETNEDVFVHGSDLIDDIQEDDKVSFEVEEGDHEPIAIDVTVTSGNEEREFKNPAQEGRSIPENSRGFGEHSERANENGRKTVRPEDLVIVATGNDDDVLSTVRGKVKWFDEAKGYGAIVSGNATGRGDEVRAVALEWSTGTGDAGDHSARKGRNPQIGKEI